MPGLEDRDAPKVPYYRCICGECEPTKEAMLAHYRGMVNDMGLASRLLGHGPGAIADYHLEVENPFRPGIGWAVRDLREETV